MLKSIGSKKKKFIIITLVMAVCIAAAFIIRNAYIHSKEVTLLSLLVEDAGEIDGIVVTYISGQDPVEVKYFNDDNKEIVGSLVNIKDSNISREFMARAYVKVGETYFYSTTTSTRSLKTVALAMQNDTANFSKLTETQQAMVNAWAAGNPVTAE